MNMPGAAARGRLDLDPRAQPYLAGAIVTIIIIIISSSSSSN